MECSFYHGHWGIFQFPNDQHGTQKLINMDGMSHIEGQKPEQTFIKDSLTNHVIYRN